MHRPLPSFAIAAVLATGLSALQGTPIPAAGLLEAVEVVPQSAVADTSELVVRRIWTPTEGAVPYGTVSADGRYLSYSDFSTGDVAVLDLRTMEKRRLTDSPFTTGSIDFALFSAISPDAKEIAYSWFNGTGFDLRLIALEGGEPHVLFSNPEVPWVMPHAWSPDGTQIAAVMARADGASQITLISVADGSTRVLKSLTDWRTPGGLTFSPDGGQIAYTFPPESDNHQNDIFLLAADGSRETTVVENPADDALLGWTPDGKALLFTSDRSGTPGVWAIRVADAEPQGDPVLVEPDVWGVFSHLGITRHGSVYYTVQTGRRDVYTATLSPEQDALVTAPTALGGHYNIANTRPAWSADGGYLAFVTESKGRPRGLGSRRIVIRSMATGETRQIVPRLTYLNQLRWAPDGGSLFVGGLDDKNRNGYFRIDAHTGDVTPLVHRDVRGVNWSRDGKTIFYHTPFPPVGVVARDMESGAQRELYVQVPGGDPSGRLPQPGVEAEFMFRSMALSPDERRLALISVWGDALQLMPVTGGPPEDLLRAERGAFGSVIWSPDGEHLLVTRNNLSGGGDSPFFRGPDSTVELWRVPLDGSEGERVGLKLPTNMADARGVMRLHPDGRQIAYVTGETSLEVWVIENLGSVLGEQRAAASER